MFPTLFLQAHYTTFFLQICHLRVGGIIIPIERLRESRVIEGDLSFLEASHIAYLGLYNARGYLGTIAKWLEAQTRRDIPLVVCDNKSTDETWSLARESISAVYSRVVFVQTPLNLGGLGAFSLNFDLFKHAEWITTFHQDDTYGANHLSVHGELVSKANPNLGLVSSEQESYSPAGVRLGYPRVHWLLPSEADPTIVFLANLKRHSLPFSGASFRRQLLEEIKIPWHSTAFPDTELVLRMLPKWSGLVDSSAVVKYLENPSSESHSIGNSERDLGATRALSRVFASGSFSQLCSQVTNPKQDDFVRGVIDALTHRILNPNYRNFTITLALEALFQEFGPLPIITRNLESTYSEVGADATTALLHKLHIAIEQEGCDECTLTNKASPGETTPKSFIRMISRTINGALSRLLGLIPRNLRRILIRKVFFIAKKLRIRTSWDFYS